MELIVRIGFYIIHHLEEYHQHYLGDRLCLGVKEYVPVQPFLC